MKRKPRENIVPHSTGDIKKDLTKEQLSAFGAVALAYNMLEDQIDALLFVVTRVPDWLFAEVSSRIHGLDGKTAIINKGLVRVGLAPTDLKCLKEGLATFGDFKKTRDAMIHARIVNASIGIGLSAKQRGAAFEVLLSEGALTVFYDHIVALEKLLSSGSNMVNGMITLNSTAADDPNRSRFEEAVQVHRLQFRANHNHRRSLKPMPKFPDEALLNEQATRWREAQQAALMGWFQHDFPNPQPRRQMSAALLSTLGTQAPPLPLMEAEKKKP